MNQKFPSTELDKLICEAVGCDEKVATIIQVKVGQQGSIPLFVCERCINKFSHENTNQTKSKRQPHPAVIDSAYDLYTKEKAGGGQTNEPAADDCNTPGIGTHDGSITSCTSTNL